MIEIKNLNIQFDRKILECEYLFFPDAGLCILKGESGSGKTSLIHCLTMETKFYDSYLLNLQPMRKSRVEKYISVLNQNQVFIEELLVYDHIKTIEKLYAFQDTDKYVSLLELEPLLHKYPNQLSGGEKARLGLLLKIMKQSSILILDEPTASLDLQYTHIVLDIIKDYALSHLVIVCTHDEELINEAEILYEIKNKTIIQKQSESISTHIEYKEVINRHLSIFKLNLNLKKKHKFYHSVMLVGLSLLIFLVSCGVSLYFLPEVNNTDDFSSVYDDEILVYKGYEYFSGIGNETPFMNEEINDLKNIKYVTDVQESYVFKGISEIVEEMDGILDFGGNSFNCVSLWNGENQIYKLDYKKMLDKDSRGSLNYCSYNQNYDYSKDIKVKFKDEKDGVYISSTLAELLKVDTTQTDYYLEFTLPIPTHQIYGDAVIPIQTEEGTYSYEGGTPVYEWLGINEKVKLPINGILKKSNMGVGVNEYLSIFFTDELIHSYIEKYRSDEEIKYYMEEELHEYERHKRDGVDYFKEIVAKPYEPILYRLKVKDLTKMQEVINEIKEKGFQVVDGDYSLDLSMYENNHDEMILVVSTLLLALLTIVYGILHYLQRDKEKQIEQFFASFGIDDSKDIIKNKHLMDYLLVCLIIGIVGLLYSKIIGPMLDYPIHFADTFIFIAVLIAFIVMFVIPSSVHKIRK